MNSTTVIPTDLVTPLGAYLRLRDGRRGVSPRVGRARAARPLLVRRLRLASSSRSRRPRRAPSRWSAISGTTTRRRSSRRSRCRPTGPDLPESRFVVADTLVRFDHAHGLAEVLWGDPPRSTRAARRAAARRCRPRGGGRGHTRRFPSRLDYERGVRTRDRAHPSRRRLPDRPLAARGAADRRRAPSASTGRCGGSTHLRTTSCSSSATSRSSARRPETLVKLDGRRASVNPIAGTVRRRRPATSSGCSPRRRTVPST